MSSSLSVEVLSGLDRGLVDEHAKLSATITTLMGRRRIEKHRIVYLADTGIGSEEFYGISVTSQHHVLPLDMFAGLGKHPQDPLTSDPVVAFDLKTPLDPYGSFGVYLLRPEGQLWIVNIDRTTCINAADDLTFMQNHVQHFLMLAGFVRSELEYRLP